MAPYFLIFFTRRYLIVKDQNPAYTGNQKLIPELLVSGTPPSLPFRRARQPR